MRNRRTPAAAAVLSSLNAATVKVGSRILARDGFSDRYGRAYGLRRTRFGDFMRVKFDDFTFDEFANARQVTAEELRRSAGGPIGYYVVLS